MAHSDIMCELIMQWFQECVTVDYSMPVVVLFYDSSEIWKLRFNSFLSCFVCFRKQFL